MKKDTVYAQPRNAVSAFEFDEAVADVFENMIERSVPGYTLALDLIGVVTDRYAMPETNCYDLGCSLGASTLVIRRNLPASCHVIGVDNSSAMVERCRANLSRDRSAATFEIREEALEHTAIQNASIVVLNFTLQFVNPQRRLEVLSRIAEGMKPGGALLLSEKIRFDNEETHGLMTELHHSFKRFHGYSDLEIAQKRTALENVLVPDTEAEHLSRLTAAGFSSAHVLTRCLNFSSFLAIRKG